MPRFGTYVYPSTVPGPRAEILSIGTELLLGQIVDTNAAYLARRLAELGIDCFHISQVGDNLERATEAVARALARADVVIVTGGLGPTEDDLTREAIAAALGEAPRIDVQLERELRGWFAARGFEMPERNTKQAWLIPSARALPNPNGTAPGWWASKGGKDVIALPGVPREMTAMWEERVEPELAKRSGGRLVVRTLKLLGVGESAVEERLGDLVRSSFPTLATYAKADGVHVRIAAKHDSREEAAAAVERIERVVRDRLGEHVWGADDDALRDLVGRALAGRGWRLAVRETLSGGALATTFTDGGVPPWFAGAAVGSATPPHSEVLLEVEGGDGALRARAQTPEREHRAEARYASPAEARRRAVLIGLDVLRRALGVGGG